MGLQDNNQDVSAFLPPPPVQGAECLHLHDHCLAPGRILETRDNGAGLCLTLGDRPCLGEIRGHHRNYSARCLARQTVSVPAASKPGPGTCRWLDQLGTLGGRRRRGVVTVACRRGENLSRRRHGQAQPRRLQRWPDLSLGRPQQPGIGSWSASPIASALRRHWALGLAPWPAPQTFSA